MAAGMNTYGSVNIYSSHDLLDGVFDPKGCAVSLLNGPGTPYSAAALDAFAAAGYWGSLEPYVNIDPAYMTLFHDRGMRVFGWTYYRPSDIGTLPDVLICSDISICKGERLKTDRDYMLRETVGTGYVREGFGGGSPGTVPIAYPVLRTVGGKRFIGWDKKHEASPSGRCRFGIANLDPDPDGNGFYTLDFNIIWTELGSDTSQLSCIYIEMDQPSTLQEGAGSSIVKEAYLIGFRANGQMNTYKMAGAAPAGTPLVNIGGLPSPPVLNQIYPCRIVVDATNVTTTFDVGGLNISMVAADVTLRGNKNMQLEQRGHGFMVGDLRRS
jgi:hypothetical protein